MTRRFRSLLLLAVGAGALVGLAPGTVAFAHAGLDSTSPEANSVLEDGPTEIVLDFDEPVEVSLAEIEVYDADGDAVSVGVPRRGVDDSVVTAPMAALDDGLYGVVWRTTSVDGHAVTGSFAFQVGTDGTVDPAEFLASLSSDREASAAVRWLHVAARWLAFLGLVALIGAGWWAVRSGAGLRLERRTRTLVWVGWGSLWLGSVLTFVFHGAEAHAAGVAAAFDPHIWNDMLSTRTGVLLMLRVLMTVALGLLLPLGLHRSDRWWRGCAVVASVVILLTFSGAGHASGAEPAVLWQFVDLVHLGGVVVWLGGLALFALASSDWYRGEDAALSVLRFSRWSTAIIPAVVVTGVLAAREYSDGFADITATGWGQVLLVKLVLVALLVVVGGVGRWMLRHHGPASVRRTVAAEAIAGLIVLGLVAGMIGESPRAEKASRSYASQLAAGGMIAAVSIGPGRVGSNEIHVVITPQGGSLTVVEAAEGRISNEAAGIPASPVELVGEGPNHFSGAVTFAASGQWSLDITVTVGDGTTVLLRSTVPIP